MTLPGPWVDPDKESATPWRDAKGIVKFFEFPVRIEAMSRRAFHLYWQRHHSPNVMNVTGFAQFIRKYNSGHVFPEPTEGLPPRYDQNTPFEGAAEVWLNSCDEVNDWLGHPLYAELIQPDEPRFIAQDGRTAIVVTREERVYAPDPDQVENGKVKLYLLATRNAELTREAFHGGLSEYGKQLVARPELQRRLLKLSISHRLPDDHPIAGLPATDLDAVIEFLFETRADLIGFLAEPAYEDLARPTEARLCGPRKLRALVAKMRVVHDEFSFQPSTTQPLPFTWRD